MEGDFDMSTVKSLFLLTVVIVLVLASGCTTLDSSGDVKTITSYRDVSVEEAKKLIDDGAFVLDVRTIDEYNSGHIEGAVLIPYTELEERISEVPRDRVIVVYCRSGRRSEIASKILQEKGFTQVNNMLGGINAWKAAGYPIE
jgi:rhodanese-related sulfurtransferase